MSVVSFCRIGCIYMYNKAFLIAYWALNFIIMLVPGESLLVEHDFM